MTLPIETGEKNEILRTVSKPVKRVTADHRKFAQKMVAAMEAERGVGIAAPQVGRNIRMVICKLNPGEKNEVNVTMINPELIERSENTASGEEGCLSLPGTWGEVERSTRVILRYLTLKGQALTLELSDFNARIIQHEIDHLDGVLFIDRAQNVREGQASAEGPHI